MFPASSSGLGMAAFSAAPRAAFLTRSVRCMGLRLLATSSLPEATAPPLILLLDLDETLLRPKLQRVHASRTLAQTDFRIIIDGSINCSASLRPGLAEFFDWIRARRASGHIIGPWIFGQGARNYIKPVLHQLDPKKDLFGDRILPKDKCTPLRRPWPWVLKSFSKVPIGGEGSGYSSLSSVSSDEEGPRDDFQQMVLVDNNVMSSILHPENTLLVRDWEGDGKDDNELARVSATLDAVIAADLADGAEGNYAKHLVEATPRFNDFCDTVADLHKRMQELPDPEKPLKEELIRAWQDGCNAKRALLGLGPDES